MVEDYGSAVMILMRDITSMIRKVDKGFTIGRMGRLIIKEDSVKM